MKDSPEGQPPALSSEPESIGVHHDAGAIAGETLEPATAATSAPDSDRPGKGQPGTARSAFFVGSGILISRIVGLIRQRIFAHYFGTSAAGDAFSAAFRIPNFLQNIFGEGALSASFIPVYAKLLTADDEAEASRVLTPSWLARISQFSDVLVGS